MENWEGKWQDGRYYNNVSITMTPEGTPVDEVPTQVTQFTDAQWAKFASTRTTLTAVARLR